MTYTDTNYTDNMIQSTIESLLQEYGLSRVRYDEMCDARLMTQSYRDDVYVMKYTLKRWHYLCLI